MKNEVHDQVKDKQVRRDEAEFPPIFFRLRPPQPKGDKTEQGMGNNNEGL